MQILMPATDSVSCSVSVSVDWSALELAGLFLWLPVNWTAEPFACLSALHSVGWSAWRSLSWTAFAPEGCSVSCCAWWPASRGQLEPWAGPIKAACDWGSGSGSELAGWVRRNSAAGVNLGGRENGNNNQTAGNGVGGGIGATQEVFGRKNIHHRPKSSSYHSGCQTQTSWSVLVEPHSHPQLSGKAALGAAGQDWLPHPHHPVPQRWLCQGLEPGCSAPVSQ